MDDEASRPLFRDALDDGGDRNSNVQTYYGDDFDDERKAGCCRRRCCSAKALAILSLVLGVIFLGVGFGAKPAVTAIMKSVIRKDAVMDSKDALFYSTWQSSAKVPVYMTFYMYNLTNADDVRNKGAKPSVNIVGPFNYHELKVKTHVEFSEDKTTVKFMYNRTFTRVQTPCPKDAGLYPDVVCSLDDSVMITTGNIALMELANTLDNLPLKANIKKDVYAFANGLIDYWQKKKDPQEDTFMTRSVHEVIWGYEDTILADVIDKVLEFVSKFTKEPLPLPPSFIQLQSNNTPVIWHNYSEIYTGKDNLDNIFSFIEWAGLRGSLNKWPGTMCPDTAEGRTWIEQANMLNGTDGMAFQPELQDVDELYVFSEDLRRSARLAHTGHAEVKGIKLRRYTLWSELLNNVTHDPSMCAFDAYMPKGALNMTSIVGGPAFASKPHFLDADPVYRQMVDGIPPPNRTLHDTTLDIEPYTGAGMVIHQRLQINAHIKRNTGLDAYHNIIQDGFYLPVTKVDEHGEVTESLAKQWKGQVGMALQAEEVAHEGGLIAGGCLIALGVILIGAIVLRRRRCSGSGSGSVGI